MPVTLEEGAGRSMVLSNRETSPEIQEARISEATTHVNGGKSVQNGGRSTEESRVAGDGRYVDPMCNNSSNPYHRCTENCLQRTAKTRIQIKEGKTGHAFSTIQRSEEGRAAKGRNVNPMCVNASNPYHRCTEYCSQGSHEARKRTGVSKSEESMEGMKMGENRKVNPSCRNASNPYHKCAEYCFQRSHEFGRFPEGKPVVIGEENNGGLKKVEKREVNSRCPNGSNPYHKCTEYCLQRIQ